MSKPNSDNPFANIQIDTGDGPKGPRQPTPPALRNRRAKKFPVWLLPVIAIASVMAIVVLGGIVWLAVAPDSKPVARKKAKPAKAEPVESKASEKGTVKSSLPESDVGKGTLVDRDKPRKKPPIKMVPETKKKSESKPESPTRKKPPPQESKLPPPATKPPATKPPNEYMADMNRAYQALLNRKYQDAEKLADKYLPTGNLDQRHLEWFLLRGALHDQVRTLQLEGDAINCIAVDSAKNRLLYGTQTGKCSVIDLLDGTQVKSFAQNSNPIVQVGWMVDRVLVADESGDIRIFDDANARLVATIKGQSNELPRAFSSRFDSLATVEDGRINIWNADGKKIDSVDSGQDPIVDFALGDGVGYVWTFHSTGVLRSYMRTSKRVENHEFDSVPGFVFDSQRDYIKGLADSHQKAVSRPNSSNRLFGTGNALVWKDVKFGAANKRKPLFCATEHEIIDQNGRLMGISASPITDIQVWNDQVVSCHKNGTIKFWETENKRFGCRKYPGLMSTSRGNFSLDGNYVYADALIARREKVGLVKTLDLAGDGSIKTWMHDRPVGRAMVSRDGKTMMTYEYLSGEYTNRPRIRFWNAETREMISQVVLEKGARMEDPMFSHDGDRFVCQMQTTGVVEIEIATGEMTKIDQYTGYGPFGIDQDGTIYRAQRNRNHSQWEFKILKENRTLETSGGERNSRGQGVFDFDGKYFANGWRFAVVFRMSDGQKIYEFKPEKGLHAATVSRDGKRVLVGDYERTRIFDIESGYEICSWEKDKLFSRFNTNELEISPDFRYLLETGNGVFYGPQPGDAMAKRNVVRRAGIESVKNP